MIRWAQPAAISGSQLQFWLQDPEVKALIAAEPGRVGRMLRPLCRGLDVALPPELVLPRRRRQRNKGAEAPGSSGEAKVSRKRATKTEIQSWMPGQRLTAFWSGGPVKSAARPPIRPKPKLA